MSKQTKAVNKVAKVVKVKSTKARRRSTHKPTPAGFERLDRKKLKFNSEVSRRFGHLVHTKRKEQGVSLRDLAKQCGISANALNSYELGHREPLLDSALAVLKALGQRDLSLLLQAA